MEGGKEEEGRAGEKRGREEREREKQRGWGEEAKEEEGESWVVVSLSSKRIRETLI